jgi:hypothetical protein
VENGNELEIDLGYEPLTAKQIAGGPGGTWTRSKPNNRIEIGLLYWIIAIAFFVFMYSMLT